MDYAVIAKNLSKSYSGREILKNCSIKVEKGIIYGLLGHNGAGKTTLFKLLLGLTRPTAGEASVLGFDIISDRKEILKHTGSLIETPVFFENLSAYENLSIHLSYMGLEDKNIDSFVCSRCSYSVLACLFGESRAVAVGTVRYSRRGQQHM